MKPQKSVLIVEDDDVIRNVLADFLLKKGFEIGIAANGREGLKIFTDKAFDLVLTDLQMPYMSGLALASEIKKKQPKTIIVLMSASEEMGARTKEVADHILTKPFGTSEISNLLRWAFESTDSTQNETPGIDNTVAFAAC